MVGDSGDEKLFRKVLRELELCLKHSDSLPPDKFESMKSNITEIIAQYPLLAKYISDKYNDKYRKQLTQPKDVTILPELHIESYTENINQSYGQNQTHWISALNAENKVLASMKDLYQYVKSLFIWHAKGDYKQVAEANKKIREFRQIVSGDYGIVTSNRLFYRSTSSDAQIVSYYDVKGKSPIVKQVRVPEVNEKESLTSILGSPKKGKKTQESPHPKSKSILNFLHTLLDTADDANTILNVFGFVFAVKPDQITLRIPREQDRVRCLESVAGLHRYKGCVISCNIGSGNAYVLKESNKDVNIKPASSPEADDMFDFWDSLDASDDDPFGDKKNY